MKYAIIMKIIEKAFSLIARVGAIGDSYQEAKGK
jgi:hypothetical protein